MIEVVSGEGTAPRAPREVARSETGRAPFLGGVLALGFLGVAVSSAVAAPQVPELAFERLERMEEVCTHVLQVWGDTEVNGLRALSEAEFEAAFGRELEGFDREDDFGLELLQEYRDAHRVDAVLAQMVRLDDGSCTYDADFETNPVALQGAVLIWLATDALQMTATVSQTLPEAALFTAWHCARLDTGDMLRRRIFIQPLPEGGSATRFVWNLSTRCNRAENVDIRELDDA